MRITRIPCSRCGSTRLRGHSVLELKAGGLAKRHEGPGVDLCAFCRDGFVHRLKSGHQSAVNGRGAIPEGSAGQRGVLAGA
jgi:hypothetical protein